MKRHHRAKLPFEQVKQMRHLRQRWGRSYAALAKEFRCGESTARDIVNYYTRIDA